MAVTVRRGDFEWDSAKAAANLARHCVSFDSAPDFDFRNAVTLVQIRNGELRLLSYAPIGGRLHVMVWAPRESRIRVISLRKANSREAARHG